MTPIQLMHDAIVCFLQRVFLPDDCFNMKLMVAHTGAAGIKEVGGGLNFFYD